MAHQIPARLTAAEGRSFALTVGGAFVVLAGVAWWRDRESVATVLAAVGALLGLLGVVVPSRLGPVHRVWMGLAALISRVTTPLFMGIVFFLVVTPIALLMRLFGKAPLRETPRAATLWHRRDADAAPSDMQRQF